MFVCLSVCAAFSWFCYHFKLSLQREKICIFYEGRILNLQKHWVPWYFLIGATEHTDPLSAVIFGTCNLLLFMGLLLHSRTSLGPIIAQPQIKLGWIILIWFSSYMKKHFKTKNWRTRNEILSAYKVSYYLHQAMYDW